jgi:hypothetical protein
LIAGVVCLCSLVSGACAADNALTASPPEPPSVYRPHAPREGGDGRFAPQVAEVSMAAEAAAPRTVGGRAIQKLTTLPGLPRRALGLEATTGGAAPAAAGTPDKSQKLVVSGAVEVSVDDIAATAAAVRIEAVRRGATIVTDKLQGARYGVSATFQLRIMPAEVDPFLAWLGQKGTIESSNLSASDVSREYLDQELRLRTLRVTLDRLEKILVDRQNVALNDVLAVEREMSRVRGEIEHLEGAHRYLADRVERATLDLHLSTRSDYVARAPKQSFMVAAHATVLQFADEGARNRSRYGAGVRMLLGRRFDLALDVFPSRGLDDRSILFSLGGALYSDFLGGGRRRFGNPFLGLRVGAGSMNNRSTLTYGAEVGVELVRMKYVLVEVTARALGLYYNKSPKGADIAFQGLLAAGVPF